MTIEVQEFHGDAGEWNAFVNGHRESTNYHLYGWKQVIEQSFGHKTHYLAARTSDHRLCGILPLVFMKSLMFGRFLVSLPYFNYGGLLTCHDDAASRLLDRTRRMIGESRADHVELRHLRSIEGELTTKSHKVTMILDLADSVEHQWQSLDPKVRNQIRKAEKNGLKAISGHLELLDGFYDVFSRNMRDLGTPVYGKPFFRSILESFPDTTRIITITLAGQPVASGLLTWFRGTLEVPWASSIRDFRELCPNNLLYWEAIRFAIDSDASRFDFGRSTPGEGTFRFKKQWGAQPRPLFWQYLLNSNAVLPELNPANRKYQLAIRLWQRLPVALTRLLGPAIVSNIP